MCCAGADGAWKPFDAPPGCPCTPRLLCQYDQRQVLEQGCDIPLHPKRTYSMHGGAGGAATPCTGRRH